MDPAVCAVNAAKPHMFMTPHSLKQASSGSRLATPGVV